MAKKIACLTRELEATYRANKHEGTKTTPCILPTECLMGVVCENVVVPCSRPRHCFASEYTLWRTSELMWISKNAYCMSLLEEVDKKRVGNGRAASPPLSSLTCLLRSPYITTWHGFQTELMSCVAAAAGLIRDH